MKKDIKVNVFSPAVTYPLLLSRDRHFFEGKQMGLQSDALDILHKIYA